MKVSKKFRVKPLKYFHIEKRIFGKETQNAPNLLFYFSR